MKKIVKEKKAVINILNRAKRNVSLSDHTNFGLKGQTNFLLEVSTPADLVLAVKEARRQKIPFCLIAGGTNIVWSHPKTYLGLVIIFRQGSVESIKVKGTKIVAPASVCLDNVVEVAATAGLAGLEKMSWIPGTIGGAVYGNAGAYGQSISETVDQVEIFDGRKIRSLDQKACHFAYRTSIFKRKPWFILSVTLKLKRGDKDEILAERHKIIKVRQEKFSNLRCPGSFFQNIPVANLSKEVLAKIDQTKIIEGKLPVGYLLEAVGAKGLKEGGLRVTDWHGNIIVNDGSGTGGDVKKLVAKLKNLVRRRFGIELKEEAIYLP